jgi:hypothetical protein
MPKLFPISIEVEELAVGKVMRMLNSMPGVAKLHLDLEKKEAKPNGRGPHKTRVQLEETGEDVVAKALYGKPPMTNAQLRDVFTSQGRSPTSINSVLHTMKNNGEVKVTKDGYTLTQKMRDRIRHREAAKKK